MRVLVLLLSLVAFATSLPYLGSKKCTWGPSYWCSHALHAKTCGAVQHCMDTVWKMQIIKQNPETPKCSLCQMVVKETRVMIKNKKTTDEVVEFFKRACEFMPNGDLKNECSAILKDSKLLIKLLNSKLSSEKLCAALSLCQGFQDLVHAHIKQMTKPKKAKVCTDCENFFQDIKTMIQDNSTVDQIRQELKQVLCAQLGSAEGMCDFVVDEYVPYLMQYLAQYVDPPVTCNVLGFCNGTDIYKAMVARIQLRMALRKLPYVKKIGAGEECTLCKDVMGEIRKMDRNPENQKKIKDFVKTEICAKLGALADECKKAVDEYGDELFELIANELDPVTVCTMIGLCQSKSAVVAAKPVLPGIEAAIQTKKTVRPQANEFCDVCKEVVSQLDNMLTENSTEEEVKNALNTVCALLPSTYSGTCSSFVEQYTPALLDLLKQEIQPDTVCAALQLCTTEAVAVETRMSVQQVKASEECVICEFIMSELDKILKKNSTDQEIESALLSVCGRLPADINKECTNFVQQNFQMFLTLLINELSPKTICTTLKFCTSTRKGIKIEHASKSVIPSKKAGSSVECVLCEYVMNEVKNILKNDRSEAAIKSALDKVCSLLPSSLSNDCTNFVNVYSEAIIKLLIQEVDPEMVCSALGLCKTKNHRVYRIMPQVMKTGTSAECVLCEFAMNKLDEELKNNRTEAAIKSALQTLCSKLPDTIKQDCSSFVAQYSDLIINLLVQELSPEEVCKELKLCSSAKNVHAVKSNLHIVPLLSKQMQKGKLGDDKCLVCKTLVNYLDEALKENATVAAVEALLDKVCNILGNYKQECDALVAQYGPQIAVRIAEMMDAKTICQDLKLCPAMNKNRLPVMMKNKDTKLYFKRRPKAMGPKEYLLSRILQTNKELVLNRQKKRF